MTFLLKFWREAAILILGVGCYLLYTHPREVIKEIPKVVEVEKIVEKTVTKTVITKPDGTTIVKDETKDTAKDSNSIKIVPPIVRVNPYRYSVGISIKDLDYKDFLIDIGARLGDTPFVATAGFDVKPRTFLLGVRYEF